MVVVSGFAFETVEQVVRVDEGVVDVDCLIHGAGEELVEADYGFACQIFLVDDLRVILDVGGGSYPAA